MPIRDGLGIWRFRRLSSFVCPPHFRPWNRRKTAIVQTAKTEQKTQKNRLFRRFFCQSWSECGDSNPGPPAPKAGALPTAQHPDMKLWNCPGGFSQSKRATNCATPGYGIVLSVVFHVVLAVFCPTALRNCFPLLVVSQRVVGLGLFPHGWAGYAPKAGALPTALHPDMELFYLWSFMWS